MCDHETAQAARADLARAVTDSQQILDARDACAGHKTSAEWLAALAVRTEAVNHAARAYLTATAPAAPHTAPVPG
jgi:hypothetical protein